MESSLENLTLSDLENLIESIVKRTLRQEMLTPCQESYQSFLETFDTWQDDSSDEDIINEIYSSRNRNLDEI